MRNKCGACRSRRLTTARLILLRRQHVRVVVDEISDFRRRQLQRMCMYVLVDVMRFTSNSNSIRVCRSLSEDDKNRENRHNDKLIE